MEKSFTIERISNGYIVEFDHGKIHFKIIDDLLMHLFMRFENTFDKKTKILVSFKIKEVDA